jgi:hypothetical protein
VGMFDHIRCEMPLPDGRDVLKESFQTKSLWCGLNRFTITAAGRLIYHCDRRDALPSDTSGRASSRVVPTTDIEMDFHGDLAICGTTRNGEPAEYAVRFTHGTVEWIRAFDSLPEIRRLWLVEQGQ